ncbi:hypothetical protein AUP41_06485 [Thalassospira xiamenensis]|nr:hypothetical protein AUP41_06485 [Thalassospira xiamenensis]
MQEEVARHCFPWRESVTNFKEYLLASEQRYLNAYRLLMENGGFNSLCDVGGFFGAFPLTLSRLGHKVAMTEALEYYSESFNPLFDFLTDQDVNIIDYDPFGSSSLPEKDFDVVTVMAVIEHYPHSLKKFMENILRVFKQDGRVYIDVPNIAYWPKRMAMLLGKTPLVPVSDIFRSSEPFIGHHHEFTRQEVRDLASLCGIEILRELYFNYSFRGPFIKRFYSDPLLTLMSYNPSMRECIGILAKKR